METHQAPDWHNVMTHFDRHNHQDPLSSLRDETRREIYSAWSYFVENDLLRRDGRFEGVFARYFPLAMTKAIRGGPDNIYPDFYAFAVGYSDGHLRLPLRARLIAAKMLVDQNPNLWGLTSGIQKAYNKGREAANRDGEIKLESRLQGA